jgi:hypothetical protein
MLSARKPQHETKRPVARSYTVFHGAKVENSIRRFAFVKDLIANRRYAESFFLPLARLLRSTFLPFFVRILFLKPCSFFLCLTFGWYVIFMINPRLLFSIVNHSVSILRPVLIPTRAASAACGEANGALRPVRLSSHGHTAILYI